MEISARKGFYLPCRSRCISCRLMLLSYDVVGNTAPESVFSLGLTRLFQEHRVPCSLDTVLVQKGVYAWAYCEDKNLSCFDAQHFARYQNLGGYLFNKNLCQTRFHLKANAFVDDTI